MTTLYLDNKTNKLNISADCTDVDPGLKIKVIHPKLPFEHGTKITYRCLGKHLKIGGDATCENGKLSFSKNSTPCDANHKTGTD